MEIRQQLVTSTSKLSSGVNPCNFITVHETANVSFGAGAQAHANLQSRGNVRDASWHWQVDDTFAIQSYLHTARCWHAGTKQGNNESIGIEICVNPDSNLGQAYANAAALVAAIMGQERIGLSHVVQHNFWTGKNCPTKMRAGELGISWKVFLGLVTNGGKFDGGDPPPPPPPPGPGAGTTTLDVDGQWGAATTRRLQQVLGTKIDGVLSHQYRTAANQHIYAAQFDKTLIGSTCVRALQRVLGVNPDGLIGSVTIRALQHRYGTPADGMIFAGKQGSAVVRALQKSLNAGRV